MKYLFAKDLVVEGITDYVGVWEIVHEFHCENPEIAQECLQSLTLEVIEDLLQSGLMAMGQFEEQTPGKLKFRIWSEGVDQIIENIRVAWDLLEGEPQIGEIGWLVTTSKGEKWVNSYWHS